MKINRMRQNVFPVVAAMIWGTSFVAQSVSADYVEAFTFNTARSTVAFLFLSVLCVVGGMFPGALKAMIETLAGYVM